MYVQAATQSSQTGNKSINNGDRQQQQQQLQRRQRHKKSNKKNPNNKHSRIGTKKTTKQKKTNIRPVYSFSRFRLGGSISLFIRIR